MEDDAGREKYATTIKFILLFLLMLSEMWARGRNHTSAANEYDNSEKEEKKRHRKSRYLDC